MQNLKRVEAVDDSEGIESRISWKSIDNKGRGVVATKDIAEGELIEHSPVILMALDKIAGTPLDDYVYWWSDKKGEEYAVGSGMLMIYNHSSDPNACIVYDYGIQTIRVFATRPIKAGQEICWNYNTDLWFDPT